MRISYDPTKNQRNIRERGLAFDEAYRFDFVTAVYAIDGRKEYGETRFIALGTIDDRLHVLCFVETPEGIRAISLRKANSREVKRYGKAKAAD